MNRLLPLIAAGLLTACEPVPVATEPTDTCGAAVWQGFLGAQLSELQVAGLPTATRIIRPGQAVTMDFSESRLNIQLDAQDRVLRAYCG
jgi:Peptidase inhibitor I78 family